jgi:hypothetical protein
VVRIHSSQPVLHQGSAIGYTNLMPYKDVAKQREYKRIWIAKRRTDWLSANGPCVDCGSWEKLEVDHENPTLKVTHRIWSWTRSRREVELAKCKIRCKACHKIKTIAYLKELYPEKITHGIVAGYLKHKCRCDKCRSFYSLWRRDKYRRIGK